MWKSLTARFHVSSFSLITWTQQRVNNVPLKSHTNTCRMYAVPHKCIIVTARWLLAPPCSTGSSSVFVCDCASCWVTVYLSVVTVSARGNLPHSLLQHSHHPLIEHQERQPRERGTREKKKRGTREKKKEGNKGKQGSGM